VITIYHLFEIMTLFYSQKKQKISKNGKIKNLFTVFEVRFTQLIRLERQNHAPLFRKV